jgi:hypothetical protein
MEAVIASFVLVGVYALITTACLVLAFLPSVIALFKKHPDLLWIFILNFGLGATALGWIVALVWACKDSWRLENLRKSL